MNKKNMYMHSITALALALPLPACGDDTAGSETAPTEADPTDDPSTGTDPDPGTTEGPTGTDSDSETGTTDDPATVDPTTVDPTTFTTTDETTESETGTGTEPGCPGEGGALAFSYIWIANAGQGTISKIDTLTLIEEGRYMARPDMAGSPSRTSVNLQGDVAVANRLGGVTKFAARVGDCIDRDGDLMIDSSTGKDDILPWAEEECRLWHAEFPQYNRMRPMAWTRGTFNDESCAWEGQLAWTTGSVANQLASISAIALDGETGDVVHTIPVPLVAVGNFGPYGGAVDADENFWFHSWDQAPHELVRVDADTQVATLHLIPTPLSPYGITVDIHNRVWIAGGNGIGRYDPLADQWATNEDFTGLGLQGDGQNRMWVARNAGRGAWGFDIETLQPVSEIDLTDMAEGSTRGVSIDFEGYVWVVENGTKAFRVDPETKLVDVYEGLTDAYTYSDMTGWGLTSLIPE